MAIIAVMLVCLGVVIGLIVVPVDPPKDLTDDVDSLYAPVTVQEFDDPRAIYVIYDTGLDVPLVAHTSGVVTRIPEGRQVDSGGTVVTVDAIPLIGLATAVPLYRDLEWGDEGQDVRALNQELARLGFGTPDSPRFTEDTRAAWVSLQKKCGVVSPERVVNLASVVWLPAARVQVVKWNFSLGALLPADGVLGTVPGFVDSARVAATDGSIIATEGRTVTVANQTTVFPDDGIITDPDFLEATIGTSKLVSSDGVEFLRQAQGTTQLDQPLTVLAVPPTAVFAIKASAACVEVDGVGIPVTIVGSSLGVTLVTTSDGSQPSQVAIGAGITLNECA